MTDTNVHNLATGTTETYHGIAPFEALVSAAILDSNQASQINNPLTRRKFAARSIHGNRSICIDNVAIDTKGMTDDQIYE